MIEYGNNDVRKLTQKQKKSFTSHVYPRPMISISSAVRLDTGLVQRVVCPFRRLLPAFTGTHLLTLGWPG